MKKTSYRWMVVLLSMALLLSACQAAGTPQPTLVPTIALGTPAPGDTPASGYPAPASTEAVTGPANLSRITAQLVEMAPDPDAAGWMRLTVTVLTSEAVEGAQSLTDDQLNQQIDLYAQAPTLPSINPGDQFTALVTYDPNEGGGRFYAQQVYPGTSYP